jgi:hypothetical protein
MTSDFRAIQFAHESLADDEKVLLLWDGRRYYCDSRCVADDEQSTAVRLAFGTPAPQELAKHLRKSGITHLMLSKPDANWFITYHDPRGTHRGALDYFTNIFFPICGKTIYRDGGMQLFKITCQ